MINEIIYATILMLLQGILPKFVGFIDGDVTKPYLLSARDDVITMSSKANRADRAWRNLLESTPVFFALTILCEIKGIDAQIAAQIWISCRVFYVPAYLYGLNALRSTLWTVSILSLIFMASLLIAI
ncbi:MAPEG family protein [Alphaproteobacteria bacterium]|jgi:uncharacterized MAPEG superfamily protein|nr:MAPEG family protein [Alphaproteobacteria bacterium]